MAGKILVKIRAGKFCLTFCFTRKRNQNKNTQEYSALSRVQLPAVKCNLSEKSSGSIDVELLTDAFS